MGNPMGVCHAGYSKSDDEYQLLDDLGVKTMRVDFHWSGIQPDAETWNWETRDSYVDAAVKHDKHVLALLDFDNDNVERDPVGRTRDRYIAPSDLPLFLEEKFKHT